MTELSCYSLYYYHYFFLSTEATEENVSEVKPKLGARGRDRLKDLEAIIGHESPLIRF